MGQWHTHSPRSFAMSKSSPRRSAKMAHFCSLRLTHTKNTFCRRARDGASDIIHAEGARGDFPSSAPKARNALRSQEETACGGEMIDLRGRQGQLRTGLAARAKNALAQRQNTTQLAVVAGHFWRAK